MISEDDLEPKPVVQIPEDHVPTVDQEVPTATYLDYDKSKTRVITYAVGTDFPGIYAENEAVARIHCTKNYGRILERVAVPGRVFFRVMK